MIYLIAKSSGEYDDFRTSNVYYTANKELAETTLARLKEQTTKLRESLNQIQKIDPSYYDFSDVVSYSIEVIQELKNDYLEVEFGEEVRE